VFFRTPGSGADTDMEGSGSAPLARAFTAWRVLMPSLTSSEARRGRVLEGEAVRRRKFLRLGLGAATVAAANASRASAGLFRSPGQTLWGGFSQIRAGETPQQAFRRMERLIDRPLAMTRHYAHWSTVLPTPAMVWSARGGRIPAISWATSGEVAWRDIAEGKHDVYILEQARRIARWGKPATFCFEHEPENELNIGTPSQFVAAYDHVHSLFDSAGATNLRWVVVLMGTTYHGGHRGPKVWTPKSHDLVGQDGYNRHADEWVSFREIFEPGYEHAIKQAKPFIINEWGCQDDPRKADWFYNADETIRGWPRLQAVIYTHAIAEFRGEVMRFIVDSRRDALSAFRKIGGRAYYGGRYH
jgi:hypothetical protein